MPRKAMVEKRLPDPDPVFDSQLAQRFVNRMMQRGKKSVAQRLFIMLLNYSKSAQNNKTRLMFLIAPYAMSRLY